VIGWLLPPLSTGSRLAGCPVSFFIRFLWILEMFCCHFFEPIWMSYGLFNLVK
jgi:hypothetical protein